MSFEDDREKVIKRFERLSDRHHKLSLLMYELSRSIRIATRGMGSKQFKEYMKSLKLDINRIKMLSLTINEISMEDLRKKDELK